MICIIISTAVQIACEKTVATMLSVLRRTLEAAQGEVLLCR